MTGQRNRKTCRPAGIPVKGLILFAAVCTALAGSLVIAPASLQAEETQEAVYTISTAEDLAELAENCSLDTWSEGITVSLENDIDLSGSGFTSIPTFAGTFEGNGYTISGISLTDAQTPAGGLFGIVQAGALIRDLTVEGSVEPDGDALYTGGIAGINYGTIENCSFEGTVRGEEDTGGIAGYNASSGTIRNCSVSGWVSGSSMTGGIAGYNTGTLTGCSNAASVNTDSVDETVSLDEIDLDLTFDLTSLSTLLSSLNNTVNAPQDSGGIAGYSSGTIRNSTNSGQVGYPHVGYNIGGIAGRSSGFISGCSNSGTVNGRKDVGGIVGQAEPYTQSTVSQTTLSGLKTQMSLLEDAVSALKSDAAGLTGTLEDAADDMIDAAEDVLSAAADLEADISIVLSDASEAAEESDADDAEDASGDASSLLSDLADSVSQAAEESSSSDISVDLDLNLDDFYDALSTLSDQLGSAADELTAQSDAIDSDLSQISSVLDSVISIMSGAADEETTDLVSDVSDVTQEELEEITAGRVYACTNSGEVEGDRNIGGIAGTVSMESSLDPDDDLTLELDTDTMEQYQLQAILQACVNTGSVTARRDCAGSIAGRVDLGLVYECEGYGMVESENGDYVGGIAGVNASVVRNCYAKASLTGENYVGGIIGAGEEESSADGSCIVSGCRSLVVIDADGQYIGAVSGNDTGTYDGNYFVSEILAGLNGISVAGQAQEVSYEELTAGADVPEEFRTLTLSFVADGAQLKSLTFSYGESFDESVYPDLPEKEGYYAAWDLTELDNLCFDTTVTAVYTEYLTAISGTTVRSDGRAVFLTEGNFGDADSISDEETAADAAVVTSRGSGFAAAVAGYFREALSGVSTLAEMNRAVIEQWSLELPEDGLDTHTIRYLASDGDTDRLRIYLSEDGETWTRVQTDTLGTYLTFPVSGTQVQVAVVRTAYAWRFWLITILVIAAIVFLCIFAKRRHGRTAAAAERKDAEEAAETAARTRGEERLHARRLRKIPKVFFCILGILILLTVVTLAVYPGLKAKTAALVHLRALTSQEDSDLELTVTVQADGQETELSAQIWTTQADDEAVSCVMMDDLALYYADGAVFLESGAAYEVGTLYPDRSVLPSLLLTYFRGTHVSSGMDGDDRVYTVTVEAQEAEELMALLYPAVGEAQELTDFSVRLYVNGGSIEKVLFEGGATLTDGTSLSLSAQLDILQDAGVSHDVPEEILEAIAEGTYETAEEISEDLYALYAAWSSLDGAETIGADITLSAQLGTLSVDSALEWVRTEEEGSVVNCITFSGASFYFTDQVFCGSSGNAVTTTEKSAAECIALLEIALEAFQRGDLTCEETDEGSLYCLSLTAEEMEEAVAAIAPDAADLSLIWTAGSVQALVSDGELAEITFSLDGSVTVLSVETEASAEARIVFEDAESLESFRLPETVKETLLGS